MGDLDRGDAKQRIKATGAVKNDAPAFAEPFSSSFAVIASPGMTDSSDTYGDESSFRRVQSSGPLTLDDYAFSGGDFDVPYQLRRISSEDYGIYLPEGCLVVDGETVAVSSFKDVQKANGLKGPWYKYPLGVQNLSCYLNVTVEKDLKEGKTTVSSVEFSSGQPKSDGASDSKPSGGKVTKTISVAISKIDDYKRPVQVVTSAIRLSTDGVPDTDGKSVELDEENDSKLQLYKFSGSDSDCDKGLLQRITATYDESSKEVTLSSGDSELMLVCRKNDRVVYVPLYREGGSQGGSEPETPGEVDEPDPEDVDPATPGAKDPDNDPGGGGGGGGGVGSSDNCGPGGVSPEEGGPEGKRGYSGCDDC